MNKLFANMEVIKEYLQKLERLHNPNKTEFIADEKTNLSVGMILFTLLNAVIEIGEEIIDIEGLNAPQNYMEILASLKRANILSSVVADELKNAMQYRNQMAHRYAFFALEKIFELAENREVFAKFLDEVDKYLKSIKPKK